MADCRRLDEYSRFVERIRLLRKNGLSADEAIDQAVIYCIDHGIMEDILLPFRADVKKMLLTEYNEKKYMKMFRKEAREQGMKEGRQIGLETGREEGRQIGLEEGLEEGIRQERTRLLETMLQNGASAEQLSELTGVPVGEIRQLLRE